MMTDTVRIDELALGQSPKARAKGVLKATVTEYAEAMKEGATFPPIDVFRTPDGALLLADGRHRVEAVRTLGATEIEATVHEGDADDALWFALHANVTDSAGRERGLPLTREDKPHAVKLALSVDAWLMGKSTREIAEHCGVSQALAYKVKQQLSVALNCPNSAESNADSDADRKIDRKNSRVEGRDGKSYAATKPAKAKTPTTLAERVAPLVEQGLSTSEIALQLGVTPSRVSEAKRSLGLTRGTSSQAKRAADHIAGRTFDESSLKWIRDAWNDESDPAIKARLRSAILDYCATAKQLRALLKETEG